MALQAKFLRMCKGGASAIYEVRGTSSELDNFVKSNYKDREPVFKSTVDKKLILDGNGHKIPLMYTSYPLPGKNMWHPLYQIQSGDKLGQYTLDKADLQFEMLVTKASGGDFGQAYATEVAKRYADSTPVSSSTAAMLSDDEEEADEEDFTATASEDAELDVVEQPASKAKANK
jgi:hypothetical protein